MLIEHSIQKQQTTHSSQVHTECSLGLTTFLGHKLRFHEFKKIELISCILSDHNAMGLEVEYKEKRTIKDTNVWWPNNLILKKPNGSLKKSKRK